MFQDGGQELVSYYEVAEEEIVYMGELEVDGISTLREGPILEEQLNISGIGAEIFFI